MSEDGKAAVAAQSPIPDPRLTTQGAISDEALRKAEDYHRGRKRASPTGSSAWPATVVTAIAIAMSLFHLYAAYDIVPTQPLRYTHVAFVLVLSFLLFPLARRFRNRIRWWDVIAAATCVGILVYAICRR